MSSLDPSTHETFLDSYAQDTGPLKMMSTLPRSHLVHDAHCLVVSYRRHNNCVTCANMYFSFKPEGAHGTEILCLIDDRGFADSKVLKAETREAIMQEIQLDPLMGYMYDIIPARSISAKMLERY